MTAYRKIMTGWALVAAVAAAALFARPDLFHLHRTLTGIGLAVAAVWLSTAYWGARFVERFPVVFTIPIAARFLALTVAGSHGTDAMAYASIAKGIRSGRGFGWQGFEAVYPPLYPTLLAATHSAFILNLAIDLGIAGLVAVIAERLGAPGRKAAWLYLMWPVAILSAGVPQKDTLAVFTVLLGIVALLRLEDRRSLGAMVLLGVAEAAVALTQPSLALVLPVVGIALGFGLRQLAKIGIVSIPVFALAMLPWWVRNFLVFHQFVPLTTAAGYSNLVAVTGSLDVFSPLGELKGAALAREQAIDILRANPLHVLFKRASAYGQALSLDIWPAVRLSFTNHPWTVHLFAVCQLYFVALLAVASRSKLTGAAILLGAVAAGILVPHLVSEFSERHRYALVALLAVLASSALGVGPKRQTASAG